MQSGLPDPDPPCSRHLDNRLTGAKPPDSRFHARYRLSRFPTALSSWDPGNAVPSPLRQADTTLDACAGKESRYLLSNLFLIARAGPGHGPPPPPAVVSAGHVSSNARAWTDGRGPANISPQSRQRRSAWSATNIVTTEDIPVFRHRIGSVARMQMARVRGMDSLTGSLRGVHTDRADRNDLKGVIEACLPAREYSSYSPAGPSEWFRPIMAMRRRGRLFTAFSTRSPSSTQRHA